MVLLYVYNSHLVIKRNLRTNLWLGIIKTEHVGFWTLWCSDSVRGSLEHWHTCTLMGLPVYVPSPAHVCALTGSTAPTGCMAIEGEGPAFYFHSSLQIYLHSQATSFFADTCFCLFPHVSQPWWGAVAARWKLYIMLVLFAPKKNWNLSGCQLNLFWVTLDQL